MRLLRFAHKGAPRYGVLHSERVGLIDGDPFDGIVETGEYAPLEEIRPLAPAAPSKVVAVGLNYRDHALELGMEPPEEPLLFLKPPSAVIGPGDTIIYPPQSSRVEFEAELAVVIGKTARDIDAGSAPGHILGYTCANDVTARDLQKRDGQWARAKGFDTFCPLGPHIETDLDPRSLEITLEQNGRLKQASSTELMIFDVFELIAFISGVMTLLPGDVVLTGTPPGVGFVTAGDRLAVGIEHIGRLENTVGRSGPRSGGNDD